MFKKLNNKGDTLAIVLIGMFVLSILGTLILGVTATNFNMKVNDKKAESTFYYAEKAIDEVYAGIGREVMGCIQEQYTDVLQKYYSNNKNAKDASSTYAATEDFAEKVRNKLTDLYMDDDNKIDPAGTAGTDKLNGRILELDTSVTPTVSGKYIKNITSVTGNEFTLSGADNYKFAIFSPTSNPTTIKYMKKETTTTSYVDLASVDNYEDVDRIEIKNFGIRCDSTSNGYSSSIVTDFVIDIPNITIDLSDSKVGGDNLGDLAKYSLIAQGHHLIHDYVIGNRVDNTKNPAISIADSSNIVINGNVYADGNVYGADTVPATSDRPLYYKNNNTLLNRNASVGVGKNVRLDINSKVFACMNDFSVQRGAEVTMGNKDGDDAIDALNSLQFYVNNIKTEKTENSTSSNNTVIDIKGNCIVKDDLQLDGDYNRITLAGNYFGYGYRGLLDVTSGHFVEDNSSAIQGYTEIDSFDVDNKEHESSSAIIINGKNTELDMSGVRKTIIMGRSYIDLEDEGAKGYYMTGESISFKGNQHMYLASSELNGSKVAGLNPIPFDQLTGIAGKTSGISYSDLGLPDGRVVAKEMGKTSSNRGDVYFYVVNSNPVAQTNYFINSYNNNDKKAALLDKLNELEVNKVSVGGVVYSVGAVTTVDSSSGTRNMLSPVSGNNGIAEPQAVTIVDVIESRTKHLTPFLQDDSSKHVLGLDNTKEPDNSTTTSATTPYEYYINREELLKLLQSKTTNNRLVVRIIETGTANNGETGLSSSEENALAEDIKKIFVDGGIMSSSTYNSKVVGYWISNEGGIGTPQLDIDMGVVISERPVEVSRDFIGLILTNGEIRVSGGSAANPVTISACEELTKLLLKSYPDLYNILSDEIKSSGSTGIVETGDVVYSDSLKYTDIVKKENWKRDTDN